VRIFILFIRIFDSVSNRIITILFRLQQLLTGLLPALAPPLELTQLIQTHYTHTYRNASSHYPEHSPIWTLEPWEEEVLVRQSLQDAGLEPFFRQICSTRRTT
jgi:hypothetical protein